MSRMATSTQTLDGEPVTAAKSKRKLHSGIQAGDSGILPQPQSIPDIEAFPTQHQDGDAGLPTCTSRCTPPLIIMGMVNTL